MLFGKCKSHTDPEQTGHIQVYGGTKFNEAYETIASCTLLDMTCNRIPAREIWKDRPALILIIRRPGCAVCREQAFMLASHADEVRRKYGVRMIAVCKEMYGASEFSQRFWTIGDTYVDPSLSFFKALGDGNFNKGSYWTELSSPFRKVLKRARKKGIENIRFQGERLILGGVLVLGAGDAGILYRYTERTLYDQANIDQLIRVCALAANSNAKNISEKREAIKRAVQSVDTVYSS